jgi:hypothetical protein
VKLATYTGTPNNITTVFPITSADPLGPDFIFPVANGRLFTRVTVAPTSNRWRLQGVKSVELGNLLATGSSLDIYVETDPNKMLLRERPSGAYDGVDRTYTIATPIPAGSEVLVIRNGMVLSPSGTGNGSFTRSGQVITLHPLTAAPVSIDQFDVLVEATKIPEAQFEKVGILQGSKNGVTTFFTLNLPQVGERDHVVVVNLNGVVLAAETSGVPDVNSFLYDQHSQTVDLGNAPDADHDLTFFTVGLTVTTGDVFDLWLRSGRPRIIGATFDRVDAATVRTTERHATEYVPVFLGSTGGLGEEPLGETPLGGGDVTHMFSGLLRDVLSLQRALNTDDIALTGNGQIVLANPAHVQPGLAVDNGGGIQSARGPFDTILGHGASSVDGQPIVLELFGKPQDIAYTQRKVLFRGVCREQQWDPHAVTINIQQSAGRLENTIPLRACTTAEFPLLPEENIGTLMPEIWGQFTNLTPILIDPSTLTFLVAGHALDGLDAVFTNGLSLPFVFDEVRRDRFRLLVGISESEQITCSGRGHRMLTTGIFSARCGAVIEDILRRAAGYSDADFSLPRLRRFKSDTPFTVGMPITSLRTVKEVILAVKAGIPSDLWWTRDGTLALAVRRDPAPQIPVLNLHGRQGFHQTGTMLPPIARTTIQYGANETVQTSGLALAVSAQRRGFLAKPFRDFSVPATNLEAIRRRFPLAADEPPIETRLATRAAAETVARMRLTLYGVPRSSFTDEFELLPLQLDIGEVFTYESPRYQAGAVSNRWLCTGLTERVGLGRGNSRVQITGWQ